MYVKLSSNYKQNFYLKFSAQQMFMIINIKNKYIQKRLFKTSNHDFVSINNSSLCLRQVNIKSTSRRDILHLPRHKYIPKGKETILSL